MLAAIGVITLLQWQLTIGSLAFEQQIGPVSVAFALRGWFVLSGYIGGGLLRTASGPVCWPRSLQVSVISLCLPRARYACGLRALRR